MAVALPQMGLGGMGEWAEQSWGKNLCSSMLCASVLLQPLSRPPTCPCFTVSAELKETSSSQVGERCLSLQQRWTSLRPWVSGTVADPLGTPQNFSLESLACVYSSGLVGLLPRFGALRCVRSGRAWGGLCSLVFPFPLCYFWLFLAS